MNDITICGKQVWALIVQKNLYLYQNSRKIEKFKQFQLCKTKKYPKIISKNCFNAKIWSSYIQEISKSPILYQFKSMNKWVLSPPPTSVDWQQLPAPG